MRGFVLTESGGVTMLSLAGKRVAVPARVQQHWIGGLSPDARRIASTNDALGLRSGVWLGKVRSGPMKEILAGTDSSFAWSPGGQRLAAAANPLPGLKPTVLRLFDRNGRPVRTLKLPGRNPERGGRAHHRVISWSPDGSRLLLIRRDAYIDTAVVALDLRTGTLRTLDRMGDPHDSPAVAWSPNGRLIALTTGQDGSWGGGYAYAVVEVASGRAIVKCMRECKPWWHPVWASDSRSLFMATGSSIVRIDLAHHRSTVVRTKADETIAALGHRLLYDDRIVRGDNIVRDTLWLLDLRSGRRTELYTSPGGIGEVHPLWRLP